MGIVRGKVFVDVEFVTLIRVIGHFPLVERLDGTWYHKETNEEFEMVTLAEALKREGL